MVVSFVLFIGTAAAGVRSFFREDCLQRRTWAANLSAWGQDVVYVQDGHFGYQAAHFWNGVEPEEARLESLRRRNADRFGQRWHYVGYVRQGHSLRNWLWGNYDRRRGAFHDSPTESATWGSWDVNVPLWPVLITSAVMPWRWWVRWRVYRRTRAMNFCVGCGYDLCASPGRCPECGEIRERVVG